MVCIFAVGSSSLARSLLHFTRDRFFSVLSNKNGVSMKFTMYYDGMLQSR